MRFFRKKTPMSVFGPGEKVLKIQRFIAADVGER